MCVVVKMAIGFLLIQNNKYQSQKKKKKKKSVKWLKILMPHIKEITPYPLFVTTKMNKIITLILTKLKDQKKNPNISANPFYGCHLGKSLAPN